MLCFTGGVAAFYYLSALFNKAFEPEKTILLYNRFGFLVAGFLLGMLLAPYVEKWLLGLHKRVLRSLSRFSPHALASGFVGLLMGFFFAILVSSVFWLFFPKYRVLNLTLTIISCVIFGYLGVLIFSRVSLWGGNVVSSIAYSAEAALPKIFDTSVLIDGRVLDLCVARFIEGKIVIPDVVLNELQGIAGDSDAIRRKRGRRGLEVVTKLKENENLAVDVVDLPATRAGESHAVDARLVNYAKSIGGILVTNDYNLSKVANLRGVNTYNLNVLSRAMRKTILPGEKVEVNVVKIGKEHGQGVAYLDDGTMIVVESGEKFVGDVVTVEINSIMQTVAGRLIFAKISDGPGGDPNIDDEAGADA
jgi:uncharacterized protein YacL